MFFEYRSHAALRKGNWKIVREKQNRPWELFDLATDPSETHNLADSHAAIVTELAEEFSRWQKSFQY